MLQFSNSGVFPSVTEIQDSCRIKRNTIVRWPEAANRHRSRTHQEPKCPDAGWGHVCPRYRKWKGHIFITVFWFIEGYVGHLVNLRTTDSSCMNVRNQLPAIYQLMRTSLLLNSPAHVWWRRYIGSTEGCWFPYSIIGTYLVPHFTMCPCYPSSSYFPSFL